MRSKGFLFKVRKYRVLLLMLTPAVLYTLIFSYLPMAGIVLAFKNYNYADGIFRSPWSGFENFRFFFSSGQAFKVTRNTILYNLAFMLVNTVLQLAVAIFLSEIRGRRFKKITQSVMFLPYFISWVIVSVIAFNFLSHDYGIINSFLQSIGQNKIDFYGTPKYWVGILIFFNAWKAVGYGSVIYLSAIMGIDTEMYESAEIDGANIFQRILYITIPSLTPTIIILLLLAVGQIFRGNFDMFYQLVGTNGILFDTTDVIDTFTFRALIRSNDVGMAAASGLYQSVFCFITIVTTNYLVKRVDKDYSLL